MFETETVKPFLVRKLKWGREGHGPSGPCQFWFLLRFFVKLLTIFAMSIDMQEM